MDSRNSVLLNHKGEWVIEEPVKQPQCAPGMPSPLEYHETDGWREDGAAIARDSEEYQQMLGESRGRSWSRLMA